MSIFSFGIAMDDQQNLFITEQGIWEKDKIMKITRAGFLDGDGNTAQFSSTAGIAVDSKGNLYVSDKDNNRIRKVSKK